MSKKFTPSSKLNNALNASNVNGQSSQWSDGSKKLEKINFKSSTFINIPRVLTASMGVLVETLNIAIDRIYELEANNSSLHEKVENDGAVVERKVNACEGAIKDFRSKQKNFKTTFQELHSKVSKTVDEVDERIAEEMNTRESQLEETKLLISSRSRLLETQIQESDTKFRLRLDQERAQTNERLNAFETTAGSKLAKLQSDFDEGIRSTQELGASLRQTAEDLRIEMSATRKESQASMEKAEAKIGEVSENVVSQIAAMKQQQVNALSAQKKWADDTVKRLKSQVNDILEEKGAQTEANMNAKFLALVKERERKDETMKRDLISNVNHQVSQIRNDFEKLDETMTDALKDCQEQCNFSLNALELLKKRFSQESTWNDKIGNDLLILESKVQSLEKSAAQSKAVLRATKLSRKAKKLQNEKDKDTSKEENKKRDAKGDQNKNKQKQRPKKSDDLESITISSVAGESRRPSSASSRTAFSTNNIVKTEHKIEFNHSDSLRRSSTISMATNRPLTTHNRPVSANAAVRSARVLTRIAEDETSIGKTKVKAHESSLEATKISEPSMNHRIEDSNNNDDNDESDYDSDSDSSSCSSSSSSSNSSADELAGSLIQTEEVEAIVDERILEIEKKIESSFQQVADQLGYITRLTAESKISEARLEALETRLRVEEDDRLSTEDNLSSTLSHVVDYVNGTAETVKQSKRLLTRAVQHTESIIIEREREQREKREILFGTSAGLNLNNSKRKYFKNYEKLKKSQQRHV